MKRINIVILLSTFFVAFAGCRDDEEDFNIVGTWQQQSSELYIDPGNPGVPGMSFTDDDPVTVVFRPDGTGTFNEADGNRNFTWTLDGNLLTISDPEATLNLTLTTMSDNRMVGEQVLTPQEISALIDLEDEDMDFLTTFPNLTARITVVFIRN
jgi:hypothetical protein